MVNSMLGKLQSTDHIIKGAEYCHEPLIFFSHFSSAWQGLRDKVRKLETRQSYHEPENPSYCAFLRGDFDLAITLIQESKLQDEAEIYTLCRDRNIDFIRCRPIAFPLTDYLKWEVENYKYSIEAGEKIFYCDLKDTSSVFDEFAKHDFMVFDSSIAFIHDYDEQGLIRGGWIIKKESSIHALCALHNYILLKSDPFDLFFHIQNKVRDS